VVVALFDDHVSILGILGRRSLRDRLAPPIFDLVGAPMEKKAVIKGLWSALVFGWHPNRDTLPRIEAAFAVEEVERDELPIGPKIVRPYVLGRALKRPT
jgi:hypothetical protein